MNLVEAFMITYAVFLLIFGVIVCGVVTFDLVTGRYKRFKRRSEDSVE